MSVDNHDHDYLHKSAEETQNQEESHSVPTAANTLLQQKIEVVQQIINVLENTMARGKLVHERNISNVKTRIDEVQTWLVQLNTKLSKIENDLSKFSTTVTPVINKFCALENILRTLEEGQAENDSRTFLPDISNSEVNHLVINYSNEQISKWKRLQEEISRLNLLTEENEKLTAIYKVTFKTKTLDESQSNQVNAFAMAINQRCGKSMIRQVEVSPYVDRFLKLSWKKNYPATLNIVNQNIFEIVENIYKNEDEITSIKKVAEDVNITANIVFQKVHFQPLHLGQRVSIGTSSINSILRETNDPNLIEIISPDAALQSTQELRLGQIQISAFTSNNILDCVGFGQRSTNESYQLTTPQAPVNGLTISSSFSSNPASSFITEDSNISVQCPRTSNTATSSQYNAITSSSSLKTKTNTTIESLQISSGDHAHDQTNNITQHGVTLPTCIDGQLPVQQICSVSDSGGLSLNTTKEDETLFSPEAKKRTERFVNLEIKKLLDSSLQLQTKVNKVHNERSNKGTQLVSEYSRSTSLPIVAPTPTPTSITNSTLQLPVESGATAPAQNSSIISEFSSEEISAIEDINIDGIILKKELISILKSNGISKLRDFQKELLPALIGRRDTISRVDENAGKSTAIAISVLQKIISENSSPQILVGTPTRACTEAMVKMISDMGKELNVICQNADEIAEISVSRSAFMNSLERNDSHVFIGMPASILIVLRAKRFQNEAVSALILDDVDIMLSHGFKPIIFQVIYALTASTQTKLTCTKMTLAVQEFSRKLRNPINVIWPETPTPLYPKRKVIETPKIQSRIRKTDRSNAIRPSLSSSPSPISTDVESLDSVDSTILGESSESISGMDIEMCDSSVSGDQDRDRGFLKGGVSSKISAIHRPCEVEQTTICARNVFREDKRIMTFIPEFILTQLGIPVETSMHNESTVKNDRTKIFKSDHTYVNVDDDDMKIEILGLLDIKDETTVIFCNSIKKVEWLSSKLRQKGFLPQNMHEHISKKECSTIMKHFSSKFCKLLVATDFFTEISFQESSLVFNYDWPEPHRNYISRAAFAEREAMKTKSLRCMVVSFINSEKLSDIEDLKKTFGIEIAELAPGECRSTF